MKRKNPLLGCWSELFPLFSSSSSEEFFSLTRSLLFQLWIFINIFFLLYFLRSHFHISSQHCVVNSSCLWIYIHSKILHDMRRRVRAREKKCDEGMEWICQIWIHNPALDLIYFDGSVLILCRKKMRKRKKLRRATHPPSHIPLKLFWLILAQIELLHGKIFAYNKITVLNDEAERGEVWKGSRWRKKKLSNDFTFFN